MQVDKILIVDDEALIRDVIKEYISPAGFCAEEAADGVEALRLLEKNHYALVILDVMMPNMDGWAVCRQIRQRSQVPIIMLSARGEEYDRLLGFELGVDDYIVKPFSPKELLARIKAILRRSTSRDRPKKLLQFPGLTLELPARNVYVDDKLLSLTPKEYELLVFLAQNPEQVFSRQQLLDAVWGYDYFGDIRTIDTHVKMLRELLGKYRNYIATVWGTGYKFDVGASDEKH